ncbi:MAG: hypothetical protein PUC23_04385 [bacterium]|nr:hypothetical protein [bacterium]
MRLDWDKDIVKTCKNNLENLGYNDLENLILIDTYNKFLIGNLDDDSFEEISFNDKEILKIIKEEVIAYKKLIDDLPNKFSNNLINLVDGLKIPNVADFNIDDKTTDDELYKLSYEIFTDVSEEFKKYLDYIYDNKLVKISNDVFLDGPCCYVDLYNKKGFVYYPKHIISSRTSSYNHELTHSINTMTNGEFYYNINPDLTEFNSIFMELYSDNFMYNKTKDNMFLYSKYNSLNRFKTDIRNIAIIKSLSEIRPTKENIICKMKDDFNIDLEDNFNNYFNDILKTLKIEIDYCYLIGLCCSLNLLNNCNLDEQKSRFMKSFYVNRRKNFFRTIDFNIDNNYYMYDILEKEFKKMDSLVRKK